MKVKDIVKFTNLTPNSVLLKDIDFDIGTLTACYPNWDYCYIYLAFISKEVRIIRYSSKEALLADWDTLADKLTETKVRMETHGYCNNTPNDTS